MSAGRENIFIKEGTGHVEYSQENVRFVNSSSSCLSFFFHPRCYVMSVYCTFAYCVSINSISESHDTLLIPFTLIKMYQIYNTVVTVHTEGLELKYDFLFEII